MSEGDIDLAVSAMADALHELRPFVEATASELLA
jgi:hypothetical protein